jgi:hypothetical protein
MSGPGECVADSTEGITPVEDLPEPSFVRRSRNDSRRRPRVGWAVPAIDFMWSKTSRTVVGGHSPRDSYSGSSHAAHSTICVSMESVSSTSAAFCSSRQIRSS